MDKLSSWKTIFFLCVFCVEAAISSPAQTFTTLHSFDGTDGAAPWAGLVQGNDGNFYGTTLSGGTQSVGTVFKITPGGSLTTLYNFCSQRNTLGQCTDGVQPYAGLVQATDGNFYGTTSQGGASDSCGNTCGTVFKITPGGTLTTLYSFCSQTNCADGSNPNGLMQATDGNFYGTTNQGAPTDACAAPGCGTVFKITQGGTLTTLYNFCSQPGCTDGGSPYGALVQATDGNFYGTTWGGGVGYGTVFKITPTGTLTTLHSFDGSDGYAPSGTLVQATDGNLYGTTYSGTIFKITLDGTLTTLGEESYVSAGLVQATDGNFYGTTVYGGTSGNCPCWGTVFEITAEGTQTTLHTFDGTDGSGPSGWLIQGADGNFYGTTQGGGSSNNGTIFSLAVGPVASVSPLSVTFGNQSLGTTSASQPVTLNNTGNANLTVTSIVVSANFGETDNCAGSVAATASCTINVTFSPTATGTLSGTLTVTDNSNGVVGSMQTVALAGTAINPTASLSATSEGFGNQVTNTTSSAKTVSLTSTGATSLSIASIAITGNNAGDFHETNSCPATLTSGAKCTISLTFTPTVLGAEKASLTVADNAANSPQMVSLTGTGVYPATLSATSLNFGNVGENTPSVVKNITLTNYQTVALAVSSITTGNTDYTETDNCTPSVAAKGSCTIHVTLTPTFVGSDTGTLTVNDSASNNPQTATLTGTGIAPATLSATSLNFGNEPQSIASASKTVTLYNQETVALTLSSIAITGTNATDFGETTTCGGSVAAKGSCTIKVTFTPSLIGAETGTLAVIDAASNSPQKATLTGMGIAQATVSASSLTFAAQKVGTTSATKTVTLTNNLSTAMTIGTITFTGTNPGDFAAPTNTCGASLAAKGHCAISVSFTPGATGGRTATMNVNDSANNTPQTVVLTGTGK